MKCTLQYNNRSNGHPRGIGLAAALIGLALGLGTVSTAIAAASKAATASNTAAAAAPAAVSSEGGDGTGDKQKSTVQPLPEIGTDQLAVFVLQRGIYVTTNLGAFFTFGGKRGYSNIQPYMAIKAGVDLNNWLSVQLAGATGFSSGNAINNSNQPGVGITSYSMFNLGAEVVGSFRPTERFAIEPVLGGGMTRINPALYSSIDGKTYSAYTGHINGGVELKYLTLLTDFSAGASLMGYYIFGVNVPAMSIAFTLRYTF